MQKFDIFIKYNEKEASRNLAKLVILQMQVYFLFVFASNSFPLKKVHKQWQ